jgi:hypothetical protein
MKVNWIVPTNGKGLWSNHCANVRVTGLELEWGELCVYFDKRTWSVKKKSGSNDITGGKHGLIYTDPLWIHQLRFKLTQLGFSARAAADVDYSEQGMQGENYVSCDVGRKFLKEYAAVESNAKTKK